MDWKAIATVAVGVIGLIGVMAQRRYNRAQGRDRAKADLDRLALLPEDSSVREELRNHTDETIRHITSVEDHVCGWCLTWRDADLRVFGSLTRLPRRSP
ncbi:hypothetical protein OG930_22245 [Streptomyces sp. NBC_01799]|uniref:hypothetical protein n=1 Tax=Streptomyces sp. NBC_01800 TaxID=2975945 RepID=UPI002DDA53DD|nr:hypothetical protein [Streptomyces sp. NBC_01800]WSA69567.1 hypothetical protein OIE65_22845 [Streptomyces sp. NBC_01800]WSA78073.1 hypothetical protein OG930_22245 [Streptomyces sp. NBC_01799]